MTALNTSLKGSDMVDMTEQQVVYEPDSPIEFVYFPEDCAISLFGILGDGGTVEIATVGPEGLLGVSALDGHHRMLPRAVVQVGGTATRVSARVLKEASRMSYHVAHRLFSYIDLLLAQAFQASACNRFHTAEQRLARFLLRHRDATRKTVFHLTQEFLAECLGANRTTVVAAISSLEGAGCIRHERGQIRLVDAAELENRACECYLRLRRALIEYLGALA
ncbi:Crp/Fnr family transcriptional regulator [Candidatus Nitrospira bockiana]